MAASRRAPAATAATEARWPPVSSVSPKKARPPASGAMAARSACAPDWLSAPFTATRRPRNAASAFARSSRRATMAERYHAPSQPSAA
jgi:hypothetical protein